MKWIVWNGNDRGPEGCENRNFECVRRDGNVMRSSDMMPWAVGYVDWKHNDNYPESDIVFFRYVEGE